MNKQNTIGSKRGSVTSQPADKANQNSANQNSSSHTTSGTGAPATTNQATVPPPAPSNNTNLNSSQLSNNSNGNNTSATNKSGTNPPPPPAGQNQAPPPPPPVAPAPVQPPAPQNKNNTVPANNNPPTTQKQQVPPPQPPAANNTTPAVTVPSNNNKETNNDTNNKGAAQPPVANNSKVQEQKKQVVTPAVVPAPTNNNNTAPATETQKDNHPPIIVSPVSQANNDATKHGTHGENKTVIVSDPQKSQEGENHLGQTDSARNIAIPGERTIIRRDSLSSVDGKASPPKEGDKSNAEFDIFKVEEKKEKYPKIIAFLESTPFQIIINSLTLYALFGDDIRVMAFDQGADQVFDVLTILSLIAFSIEITLTFIAKEPYRWSFFFWLDLVSTVTLVLDITTVSQTIFSGGGGDAKQTAKIARAGRASRVGTKAGRIVRLVRLIRIVKLYQAAAENQNAGNSETELQKKLKSKKNKRKLKVHPGEKADPSSNPNQINENGTTIRRNSTEIIKGSMEDLGVNGSGGESANGGFHRGTTIKQAEQDKAPNLGKESRVSKRLSDLTTKRVIIIVLLLLFIMPLFSADYFFDPPKQMDFSTYLLKNRASSQSVTPENFALLYNSILKEAAEADLPLASMKSPWDSLIPGVQDFYASGYDDLRWDEKELALGEVDYTELTANKPWSDEVMAELQIAQTEDDTLAFISELNTQKNAIRTAGFGFGRTIFVCIVLTMGAIMFAKDANDIALRPIERMIEKVNKIAKNPISAKQQQLEKDEDQQEQMQTVIIENAIVKIGILLALGFGDAGSEIIATNMARSGDVDPMIPGQKKVAIYGFCDIRNFTDATEVLQEQVMLFVNNIGEVVHSMTDRFMGAANKNIGDAFLLVWKIPVQKYTVTDTNEITYHDIEYIKSLADLACLAFVKIQAKINREPKLLAYRLDDRLQKRMPNYKVKIGFGLHMGWGIEGAIGSEFKIDASYLSPNVNMAGRLEASTKQYGVPLLISNDLQQKFSPGLKKYTRYIDRVAMSASDPPYGLYTIDMDSDNLPVSQNPEESPFTKKERFEIEQEKQQYVEDILNEYMMDIDGFIQGNKDLRLILAQHDPVKLEKWSTLFEPFLAGQWVESKKLLDAFLNDYPGDGPAQNLLNCFEQMHFQNPEHWLGFRVVGDAH